MSKSDSPEGLTDQAASTDSSWSPRKRAIISAIVAFHLFAVIAAPMANPQPASQLFGGIARVLQPYIQAMYLNHGYRFFAPEPGPSHIIRYEIFESETESEMEFPEVSGVFPDRNKYWPRQLYHRWFMLSETVFADSMLIPSEEEFKVRNERVAIELKAMRGRNEFQQAALFEAEIARENQILNLDKAQQERILEAIGQDLLRRHDGQRIKLYLCTRLLPPMLDIQDGKKLKDKDYFNSDLELYLGTTTRNKQD